MSGVGYTGGTSRCWYEWQKFLDCYTAKDVTDPSQCKLFAEDYTECLHHSKEIVRARKIAEELERREKSGKPAPTVETHPYPRSALKDLGLVPK